MPPTLIVTVLGDTSNLEKSLKRTSAETQQFSKNVEKAGRGATAASLSFRGMGRSVAFASAPFLGAAGFVSVAKSASEAASNLNEQTTKTQAVFGDSAKSVKAWSQTTVTSMGLAEDQALEAASSFGALLRPIGLTGDAAARQSTRLTQLGADLASFYNTSVSDALAAIRSGLVGEVEPLRRYGAILSETRVQQEALTETGKRSATQLTVQEKVAARLALIFRDTSLAQGDFAKTSGGLANQERILSANVRQLEINLGKALNPQILKVTTSMNKWLESSENQQLITDTLNTSVEILGPSLDALAQSLGAVALAGQQAGSALSFLNGLTGGISTKALKNATLLGLPPIVAINKLFGGSGGKGDFGAGFKGGGGNFSGTAAPPVFGTSGAGSARVFKPGGLAALSPLQRNAITLSQADTTAETLSALAQQRDLLARQIETVTRHLKNAKGPKAAREFADQLVDLNNRERSAIDQIASINTAAASAAAASAAKAKDAAKKNQQALIDTVFASIGRARLGVSGGPLTLAAVNKAVTANEQRVRKAAAAAQQAAQFRGLGLTATGDAITPTGKTLGREASQISAALKGTVLDTDKNRNMIARVRKVLSGQFGALTLETRKSVKGLLDALRDPLKDADRTGTGFKHLSPNKLARQVLGPGADAASIRRAASVLSQVGRGGSVPGTRSAAFAGGGVHFHGPVTQQFHGVQNVRELAGDLAKVERRKATVRRGAR